MHTNYSTCLQNTHVTHLQHSLKQTQSAHTHTARIYTTRIFAKRARMRTQTNRSYCSFSQSIQLLRSNVIFMDLCDT